MNKKRLLLLIPIIALALVTGCGTTGKISPSLVQQGVATGVSYGVSRYPQAIPGVKIAGEVVCSVASGTNLSPANVVAAIQQASPNISPETTLIINGALTLYVGLWESYGANVVNSNAVMKPYLQATCSGITQGLGGRSEGTRSLTKWPLVQSR